MASSSSGNSNVRFIAVARVADRTIVATHGPKIPMERKTSMILASERLEENSRLTINDREVGTIHYESDSATLYLVVTSENYPQRVAFQFLSELQQTFESLHQSKFSSAKEHELTRTSCKLFLELVRKYEHPHQVDKLASVSVQVDQVKGMMQENINTVLSNKENLSHLVHDTQNMAQEASQFQRTAQTTHNNMWWKNMKVLVGIVVLLVVLVAVIAAAFFFNQKQPVV